MRTSDWVICAFFAYLIVLARVFPLSSARRGRVLVMSLVTAGTAVMLSQLRLSPVLRLLRDWLPALYVLQGYWISGLFFRRPMRRVEDSLLAIDRTVFRVARLGAFAERAPRALLEGVELAYLLAYPIVPAGFALVYFSSRADGEWPAGVDRFWTVVLGASYACYGALPWIQTRPPRAIDPRSPWTDRRLWMHRVNERILERASIHVNTLPSGHAASSLATALAVAAVDAAAGALFLVLAANVSLATVVGRYHFTVDTILGVLVAVMWWGLAARFV